MKIFKKKYFNKFRKKLDIDKKADSKLFVLPFFINIILITVAIVIGFLIFYSFEFDVRVDESKIIVNKLINAMCEGGYLKEKIFDADFNPLKEAFIDEKNFENEENFYYEVEIYEKEKLIKKFRKGDPDFKIQCNFYGKDFARCFKKNFFVLDKNDSDKIYEIKILAASNQKGAKI